MTEDEQYMALAMREAEKARQAGEVPCGCVIVKDGRVIARGWNQVESLKDATAHAEMIALTAATEALGGKYLDDCTLYVTVEPCPMCAAALCWAQLGRLVYGAPDPRRGYSLFSPALLHPRTGVSSGLLAGECGTLVKDYFKNKR